jgi:putative sporulation protein YyaC
VTALCEVDGQDAAALAALSLALEGELARCGAPRRPVTFACIGTDRSTGDALGPLVGQRLRRLGCDPERVIGTLEHPLHALNLAERLAEGRGSAGAEPLVVAIDAALGPLAGVGTIAVRRGGLRPGQGVGKDLPAVGELAVTATVNVQAGALDSQVLQSTRLYLVQGLAETIGTACWWALRSLERAAVPAAPRAARSLRVA